LTADYTAVLPETNVGPWKVKSTLEFCPKLIAGVNMGQKSVVLHMITVENWWSHYPHMRLGNISQLGPGDLVPATSRCHCPRTKV